jgi:hypothetical protein
MSSNSLTDQINVMLQSPNVNKYFEDIFNTFGKLPIVDTAPIGHIIEYSTYNTNEGVEESKETTYDYKNGVEESKGNNNNSDVEESTHADSYITILRRPSHITTSSRSCTVSQDTQTIIPEYDFSMDWTYNSISKMYTITCVQNGKSNTYPKPEWKIERNRHENNNCSVNDAMYIMQNSYFKYLATLDNTSTTTNSISSSNTNSVEIKYTYDSDNKRYVINCTLGTKKWSYYKTERDINDIRHNNNCNITRAIKILQDSFDTRRAQSFEIHPMPQSITLEEFVPQDERIRLNINSNSEYPPLN